MPAFADARDVDRYVGGIIRLAAADPVIGPALAAASLQVRLVLEDPACEVGIGLSEPVHVTVGATDAHADVTLRMRADQVDAYWRGDYDLLEGIARGEVVVIGRISRVLKLLPVLTEMFPVYRALVAGRSRASESPREGTPSPAVPHPRTGAIRRADLRSRP